MIKKKIKALEQMFSSIVRAIIGGLYKIPTMHHQSMSRINTIVDFQGFAFLQ